MAVVAGGSKTNLVESYAEGEDTGLYYGKNRWISQTFTLDEETAVWRFLLKSWAIMGGRFYHYDLHETDGAGKPTGDPLAETTSSPTGEHWYSPGKWRRFDFSGWPKLAAGQYALVASVPDAPHWKSYKLSANSTTSTYTRGKCWRSHDSGATWEEVANTDLMFQVWGYSPPPEPPPEPVISNWAPYQLEYTPLIDGYKIFFTTDSPCHLFMRWTLVPPQQHKIPRLRRGVYLFDDKRFCFVAWHENEQLEPGDTYNHTFVKTAWPVCETRYFYFVGTRQAEQQPSTSAIFTKHRYQPPPPGPTSDCHLNHDYMASSCQHWNAASQTFAPDHDYIARRISLFLCQYGTDRKGPYIVKLTRVNGNPFEEELLWSEVRQSVDLPLPGEPEWIDFDYVAISLQEGVTYRIIVHTIPPWFLWDGEEWQSAEWAAGIQWWFNQDPPYLRGAFYYGANFRDETGLWSTLTYPHDFTFCVYE